MSQVGTEKKDTSAAAQTREALDQLNRMMEQGRSFSGHERNCCFLNTGGPRFATVSAVTGLDYPDDGRALAVVDWDQDGRLDLWVSNRNAPRLRLLRNLTPRGDYHFLALRLQGNGTTTNRDAVGARVEVVSRDLNGKRLIRALRAGEGFLAQSSKWVHIGLGRVQQIDKIVVRWPGGMAEEFIGLEADRRYHLVQGSGRAFPVAPRSEVLLMPAEQETLPTEGTLRIPLATLLPMPRRASYLTFDGAARELAYGGGRPMLITLFASWCAPCQGELKELTRRADELRAAGVDVLALAVDGLGDDGSRPEAAAALLDRLKFPFPAGRARPEFVQLMQGYNNLLVVLTRQLPIPTSLLIDGQGRLSVIYKGPVSVDDLLADARASPQTPQDRWARAACLPGRMLQDAGLMESLLLMEARTRFMVAEEFARNRRYEDAALHYTELLALQPTFATGHESLGLVFEHLRRDDEADAHYRRAIELAPHRAGPHYKRANLSYRRRNLDEAAAGYRKAIELAPEHLEAHVNLGAVLIEQKKYEEAARHFRRALEIDPACVPARENLRQVEMLLRVGG